VTGIRIRGGATLDNPTKALGNQFPPSGEKTILRNMTIFCKDGKAPDCKNPDIVEAKKCRDEEDGCSPEGGCIHGIHASTAVRIENVTVEFFAHDGIHIVGSECGKQLLNENGEPVLDKNGDPIRVYDGNANGSYIENCQAGQCGRDGFHFRGGDANACVIIRCSGVVNGRAGFYDETFGNTYLGCLGEANCGPNYITKGYINASVFINCWSEGGSPPSEFKGQVTIISGKIGGNPKYMTADSSAFILEHGVATRAPLVYKNLAGKKSIGVSLGDLSQTVQGPGNEMIAFQWATLKSADDQNIEDFTSLRYLDEPEVPQETRGHAWWALAHNNSFYRHMIRFPTTRSNARLPAPWFVNGIYLGRDDVGPPKVSFTAAPAVPNTQDSGAPLTYEKGDVVWSSEPSQGSPIGQVCISSGTQSILIDEVTIGSIGIGDTELTVRDPTSLESGQYITIDGIFGVTKIVGIEGFKVTIDTPTDATVVDALVAFSPATFATFGTVDTPSRSYGADHILDQSDRYITITATSTQTLPANPIDGQIHDIKSGSGVTTTVNTGGSVLTIDEQASVTLAPRENGTFRYSAATGNWELR
jgi:hypothetical protein